MLIEHASADARYRDHPSLRLRGIESYAGVPLRRRDGSVFGTLCTLDQRPTSLSAEIFDVFTLLAQLIAFELEADEQQQLRERELRALEDAIAVTAHDLRQPLTVLSGRAQLLARKVRRSAAPELAVDVEALLVQSRRAIALSDMLLDVARIDTGVFTLAETTVDFCALARRAIDDMRAVTRQHEFQLVAPTTLTVRGDEGRLQQVLSNVLDNAAKYASAQSGPIVVTIAALPDSVVLHVSDGGSGVPEEDLPRLFTRHFRSTGATAGAVVGSGLGLYIAREIVLAHGGTITAANAPGGGLNVSLTLPRRSTNDSA